MDEITELMSSAASVGNRLDSSSAPPERAGLYKKRAGIDQRERRAKILELQKRQRKEIVNQLRQIEDDDWQLFKNDYEWMETGEDGNSNRQKSNKPYKDQLMLSEWMVDIPEEFESNWVMVPCSEGRRALVVAACGTTSAYSKAGYRLKSFPSMLPGGCKETRKHKSSRTLLDCIYSEMNKTFYVLDVICWNGHYVIDCETEFRFYWLRSMISETDGVSDHSRLNPYIFHPLPTFNCSKESIAKALENTYHVKIDGLLFYHKHTHYLCGSTPLVVWLKPYMVPEVLGIEIHERYMADKPAAYSNIDSHINLVRSDKTVSQTHQELYAAPDGGQSKAEQIILKQSRLTDIPQSYPLSAPQQTGESYVSQAPTQHKFGQLPDMMQTAVTSGTTSDSGMVCEPNTSSNSQGLDQPRSNVNLTLNAANMADGQSFNSSTSISTGVSSFGGLDNGAAQSVNSPVTLTSEPAISISSPLSAANTWNYALSLTGQTEKTSTTEATSSINNQWTTFR